jgi:sugar lactone lactonase YvrE
MILTLLACKDPVAAPVAADPCEEPGSICAWLGVPGQALLSDDGLDRLDTRLHLPVGLSFGSDGTAFYSDYDNHRVREVEPDGVVETLSGTGMLAEDPPCWDGCEAATTGWNHPMDVVQDPADPDWITVAAFHDGRLYRIQRSTGTRWTRADGVNPARLAWGDDGALYFTDPIAGELGRVLPDGAVETVVSGLALGSKNDPSGGVAFANGALVVTDRGAGQLLGVDPATGAATVLASGFTAPAAVAAGPSGEWYVADPGASCVWRVDGAEVEPFAGSCAGGAGYSGDGGPAADAVFDAPYGVAVDADGAVYVADTYNHVVRRVAP